jgi:hypothetical protein
MSSPLCRFSEILSAWDRFWMRTWRGGAASPVVHRRRSRRCNVAAAKAAILAAVLLHAPGVDAGSIDGGWGHTVIVRPDGTVWTWGANNNAQLGDATIAWHSTPWQVPGSGPCWGTKLTNDLVSRP